MKGVGLAPGPTTTVRLLPYLHMISEMLAKNDEELTYSLAAVRGRRSDGLGNFARASTLCLSLRAARSGDERITTGLEGEFHIGDVILRVSVGVLDRLRLSMRDR
jgi:hypothetical protein